MRSEVGRGQRSDEVRGQVRSVGLFIFMLVGEEIRYFNTQVVKTPVYSE